MCSLCCGHRRATGLSSGLVDATGMTSLTYHADPRLRGVTRTTRRHIWHGAPTGRAHGTGDVPGGGMRPATGGVLGFTSRTKKGPSTRPVTRQATLRRPKLRTTTRDGTQPRPQTSNPPTGAKKHQLRKTNSFSGGLLPSAAYAAAARRQVSEHSPLKVYPLQQRSMCAPWVVAVLLLGSILTIYRVCLRISHG